MNTETVTSEPMETGVDPCTEPYVVWLDRRHGRRYATRQGVRQWLRAYRDGLGFPRHVSPANG